MQYQMNQIKYVTKYDKQLKHSGPPTANTNSRKYDRSDASSSYTAKEFLTKHLGMSWMCYKCASLLST